MQTLTLAGATAPSLYFSNVSVIMAGAGNDIIYSHHLNGKPMILEGGLGSDTFYSARHVETVTYPDETLTYHITDTVRNPDADDVIYVDIGFGGVQNYVQLVLGHELTLHDLEYDQIMYTGVYTSGNGLAYMYDPDNHVLTIHDQFSAKIDYSGEVHDFIFSGNPILRIESFTPGDAGVFLIDADRPPPDVTPPVSLQAMDGWQGQLAQSFLPEILPESSFI